MWYYGYEERREIEMSKLLLIMGDLATGKSTFANMLSQRYSVSMFGKDTIKEVLGDSPWQTLPYNLLAPTKYERLGKTYKL